MSPSRVTIEPAPPRRPLRISPFSMIVLLVVLVTLVMSFMPNANVANTTAKQATTTATPLAIPTVVAAFDPSVNAPLPYNRIVTAYGITGGVQFNGPASTLDLLTNFLPQLQALGKQYATLDPTHPVKLGIDLVVNVFQPCATYSTYCSSFVDDATMQTYVDFCQQHNLLLFFDMQFGVMPVKVAIGQIQGYLEKYPFTEVALDTEFHFPYTAQGHASAAAYPGPLGWMGADEINWAIDDLASISAQQHQPRKVLIVHQWEDIVIHDKDKIVSNPAVSVVLQSDGWGYSEAKLSKYQSFVQQDLIGYGGYKLFFQYDGDGQYDRPLQSPADVMRLFPQPLFISYQ